MCPPCVGGSYCPNCACTSYGTCLMDYRARNASTTFEAAPRPCSRSTKRTRKPRTTNGKRTHHRDAPGNDTNGNTYPTPRLWQTQKHRQATFGPPAQKNKAPTSNIRTLPGKKQSQKPKSSKTVATSRFKGGFRVRKSSNPQKVALRK